jgi:hypothetical protein
MLPNTRLIIFNAGAYLLLSALIAALCCLYVTYEQPLYFFDYGLYWGIFSQFSHKISEGEWVAEALRSISTDDYNVAAAIPLYVFFNFLGDSREVYIFGVAILYLIPTAVIAALIANQIGIKAPKTTILLALLYVPFWEPTLRGLPDIVGCIFLGLATLLILRCSRGRSAPISLFFLLGVLTWLPFLFRRWYAYSIIIFYLASYLLVVLPILCSRDFANAVRFTLSMALAGLVTLSLVLIFQYDLVERIISTDYGTLYEAYHVSTYDNFLIFYNRTGFLFLCITAFGLVSIEKKYRPPAVFLAVTAFLTEVFFSMTQYIGPHHYLPIALWLFPLYAAGLLRVGKTLGAAVNLKPATFILPVPVLIFGISISGAAHLSPWAKDLFGATNIAPLHIENFANYQSLTADIKRTSPAGGHVAVFASSDKLSFSLLSAIDPSIANIILVTPQRDRDGIVMLEALDADLAVWTTPTQIHLAPGSQTIVTLPNEMLRDGRGFGAAFGEVVGAYELANGIRAVLAKRTRPVTTSEKRDFLNELLTIRPDMRPLIVRTMSLAFGDRIDVLGDTYGTVSAINESSLYLHPGVNSPTRTTLTITGEQVASVDLGIGAMSTDECAGADGVEATVRVDGALVQRVTVGPGAPAVSLAVPDHAQSLEIEVASRSNPTCDQVTATFHFK